MIEKQFWINDEPMSDDYSIVLHSSAFLPQSKVYSVQTRLVSGKVEALVTRLLPLPLSLKMDSSIT